MGLGNLLGDGLDDLKGVLLGEVVSNHDGWRVMFSIVTVVRFDGNLTGSGLSLGCLMV